MPTILRDKSAVQGASMEDLNHTFRALRGEPDHPGFTNVDAARTQVQMAIMAAEDAAGHVGVPPNTRPRAKTVAELGHNPYVPGSMSHALHAAVHAQHPIVPRARWAVQPRVKFSRVRATFAGTSRPQAGSVRAAVLAYVQAAPDNCCTVEALEKHFAQPVRGYLQKLIEKNHLTPVTEEQQQ
jgi:hypothetical protein